MTVFDATLGGASANSYIDVATADALMPLVVSNTRATAWAAIDPAAKEVFLMRAVKMLETYIDFEGSRVLSTQPLAWPRDWVYGLERTTAYPTDEIPSPVAEAQAMMALNLSEDFDQADAGSSPIDKFKLSTLSIDFVTDRSARGQLLLPAEVVEKLRGFGTYSGSSGQGRSLTMERA